MHRARSTFASRHDAGPPSHRPLPCAPAHIQMRIEENSMDNIRFDGLARTVATWRISRQSLVRGAAGAGLAAILGGAGREAAARSCRRNGRVCLPVGTGSCCSGLCELVGRRVGRCRARPAAQGCSIRDDSCAPRTGSQGVPCPRNANGRCFILRNGRPLCATRVNCFNCSTHDDCNREFRRSNGRCAECDSCSRHNGRVCLFP